MRFDDLYEKKFAGVEFDSNSITKLATTALRRGFRVRGDKSVEAVAKKILQMRSVRFSELLKRKSRLVTEKTWRICRPFGYPAGAQLLRCYRIKVCPICYTEHLIRRPLRFAADAMRAGEIKSVLLYRASWQYLLSGDTDADYDKVQSLLRKRPAASMDGCSGFVARTAVIRQRKGRKELWVNVFGYKCSDKNPSGKIHMPRLNRPTNMMARAIGVDNAKMLSTPPVWSLFPQFTNSVKGDVDDLEAICDAMGNYRWYEYYGVMKKYVKKLCKRRKK